MSEETTQSNTAPAPSGASESAPNAAELSNETNNTPEPNKSAADLVQGEQQESTDTTSDDTVNKDNDSETDSGQYERPSWLDKKWWDESSGEVNVEGLQKALKETQKMARDKGKLAPEPTDDNPMGYDLSFMTGSGDPESEDYVEGLGFDEASVNSEEFQKYLNDARESNVPQEALQWSIEKFVEWKDEYDRAAGLDIDPYSEAERFNQTLVDQYGPRAEDVKQLTLQFLNSNKIPADAAWGLSMTSGGLELAAKLASEGMNPDPVSGAQSQGGRTLEDVNKEITKLQNDPRRRAPHGTDERKTIEKELDKLFMEKVQMGDGAETVRDKKRFDPNYKPGQPDWGPSNSGSTNDEKYRRLKLNVAKK